MAKQAGYSRRLKTMLESSVRSKELAHRARMQPEPGRYFSKTGCARHGLATAASRFGAWSALPGVQSSAYRTKGFFFEHGNSNPSAGHAKSGKPISPARSRMEDGASVVVRARESRVHREGRQ